MADKPRHARFDERFLKLVHRLVERGHEHAEAVRIARTTIGIQGDGEPTEPTVKDERERTGRIAEPKRRSR